MFSCFQAVKQLQASRHFFLDVYYIHEPPSEQNQCEVSKGHCDGLHIHTIIVLLLSQRFSFFMVLQHLDYMRVLVKCYIIIVISVSMEVLSYMELSNKNIQDSFLTFLELALESTSIFFIPSLETLPSV